MHYFNPNSSEQSKKFKAEILAVMQEFSVTYEDIADALGVDRSSVSRWFTYTGDLHFPASLTSLLHSKKLRPVALAIIRFQAHGLGIDVRDNSVEGKTNGTLDDEFLEIGRLEGRLIDAKNMQQVIRLCDEMDRVTQRVRMEIREKQNG